MKAWWCFPAVALCLFPFISTAAQLLSVDHTGTRSGNAGVGESFAISSDGRFAVFNTTATNYVLNDTNHASDVFVHDCLLRQHVWNTTFALSPIMPINGRSTPWALSPDARYLVFVSTATNLVPGAAFMANGSEQVYWRDLASNVTTLVSIAHDGSNVANGFIPSSSLRNRCLSSDGRFVSFVSTASNLVALTDTNVNSYDVFCRDVVSGTTQAITVAPEGDRTLDVSTASFVMSTNGRFFAFTTRATNVIAGMVNAARTDQVYWRDRVAGTNTLVSIALDGGFASTHATLRDMSRDGRFVCFLTSATNIVADQNDSSLNNDLFIRDMLLAQTWLVSRSTNGGASGTVEGGQFSANGNVLIFSASTANLAPNLADANGFSTDIFAHYVQGRSNALVSVSWQGNTGADAFASDDFANISATGRFVLFTSSAGNLIPGYATHVQRLYLRDLQSARTLDPLRSPHFPTFAFNYAHTAISDTERYIFFMTQTNFDASVADNNNTIDLFRAALFEPRFLSANPLIADALPNTTYILEASTNLLQWLRVQTNTADSRGRITFKEPITAPQRFYRLLWP